MNNTSWININNIRYLMFVVYPEFWIQVTGICRYKKKI